MVEFVLLWFVDIVCIDVLGFDVCLEEMEFVGMFDVDNLLMGVYGVIVVFGL